MKIAKLLKINDFVLIGAGRWGNALTSAFKDCGYRIHSLDAHSSPRDWDKAFEKDRLVLIATPFSAVSSNLKKLKKYKTVCAVFNASKGIDQKSLRCFSQLSPLLGKIPTASISGPSFAKELRQKKPTACVLASKNKKFAQSFAEKLSTPYFRLYAHSDPVSVEICGAVKNVMAIACGISDGLKLGDNARAALLSRALMEIVQLLKAHHCQPTTAFGLAGVGDLWMTATGKLSRNRQFGCLIAQGKSKAAALKKINQPVEGLYTVSQVEKLRKQKKLKLPICEKVYAVCNRGSSPKKALQDLMTRAVKIEESSEWRLQ